MYFGYYTNKSCLNEIFKSFAFLVDEFYETLLHISFLNQGSEYRSPFESDNKCCQINKDKRIFS